MAGGFDPGRFAAAPLQTQGVIRFHGLPDPVFARIADHAAMTDWVALLETAQVWHPKPLPPGQSMAGTARAATLRHGAQPVGAGAGMRPSCSSISSRSKIRLKEMCLPSRKRSTWI